MDIDVISLEAIDDFVSARRKVTNSRKQRVLLVYPERGNVLDRRLDILFLQRASRSVGKQLALVTSDTQVQTYARDIGISVFPSIEIARHKHWRRSSARWVRVKSHILERLKMFETPDGQVIRLRRLAPAWKGIHNIWLRVVIFMVGLLAAASLVLFFLPTARIKLSIAEQTQQLSLDVWANPSLHAPNLTGGVPAYLTTVMVEGHDQIPSSGSIEYPDTYATGVVVLTNLVDEAVDVPVGSIVTTQADVPVQFEILSAISLPAGKGETRTATVKALLPGPGGNVDAGKIQAFAGSIGLRVAVNNLLPMQGGGSKISPMPVEQDYQTLHQRLLKELEQAALVELQKTISSGQVIIPGTLQLKSIVEEKREPESGQPSDNLLLTTRAEYSAWIVLDADVQSLAKSILDANLQPNTIPIADTMSISSDTSPHMEGDNARWKITVKRKFHQIWSADILSELVGKEPQAAKNLLEEQYHLAQSPQITLYPYWLPRLPYLTFQIKVDVE